MAGAHVDEAVVDDAAVDEAVAEDGSPDDARRTLRAFWHDDCLDHEPPAGDFETPWTGRLAHREPHPDRPERIENVRSILETELDSRVEWREAPLSTIAQLERVHERAHVEELQTASERAATEGPFRLTRTTGINEATFRAARRAAGGAVAAAEAALSTGPETVTYSCTRPSGHHAGPATADGFCYLNNVAVAAETVLAAGDGSGTEGSAGADRVAVLDWDVHQGNGTQRCFYDRDDVLVLSIHNDHGPWEPEYHPETGAVDECGVGDGEGYSVNVPLPAGVGNEGYAAVFDRLVAPVVREFNPDLLLCSAGGDAGVVDPLGRNLLTVDGFTAIGRRVDRLAQEVAGGSLALVQEGGYQVSHLAYAMLGTLAGALGVDLAVEDPMAWMPEDPSAQASAIDEVVAAHADHWPVG